MKKAISLAFAVMSLICNAQEKQEITTQNEQQKLYYTINVKIGFSQLQLLNYNAINGNVTQADFLLSSRLSDKFRLEYGFGASDFNGNTVHNNQLVAVKNEYYRIPINLMYNKAFNEKISLIYGLGIYGNYLHKSNIPGYFEEKNVGFNLGGSLQIGANFNLNDKLDLRIMYECQNDLTKIEKQSSIKQKQTQTNLIAFNFVCKF
jgi:hypothetical protein